MLRNKETKMAEATTTEYNMLEIVLAATVVIIAITSIAVVFIPGMLAYVG